MRLALALGAALAGCAPLEHDGRVVLELGPMARRSAQSTGLSVTLVVLQNGVEVSRDTAALIDGAVTLDFSAAAGVATTFEIVVATAAGRLLLRLAKTTVLGSDDRAVVMTAADLDSARRDEDLPDADEDGVADLWEVLAATDPDSDTSQPGLTLSVDEPAATAVLVPGTVHFRATARNWAGVDVTPTTQLTWQFPAGAAPLSGAAIDVQLAASGSYAVELTGTHASQGQGRLGLDRKSVV
jgi:hypothetical protein